MKFENLSNMLNEFFTDIYTSIICTIKSPKNLLFQEPCF